MSLLSLRRKVLYLPVVVARMHTWLDVQIDERVRLRIGVFTHTRVCGGVWFSSAMVECTVQWIGTVVVLQVCSYMYGHNACRRSLDS